MDPFLPLTLNDKNLIEPFLRSTGKTGAEYSFTTLYMWSVIYKTDYRIISYRENTLLLVRSRKDQDTPFHYLYPMGLNDPLEAEAAREILIEASEGEPFLVGGLSSAEARQLAAIDPVHIKIQPVRDAFDYLYKAEDLAELRGKKYQSKRNHLNAFLKEYPGYQVQPIYPKDIPACITMNDKWCRIMGCNKYPELGQEACAVRRAFCGFTELGLEGMIMLIDREIIACTVGELFNGNTWLVHIEKAFPKYRGVYQAINQMFIRYAMEKYPQIEYVNREDDSGDKGLRQAKLSYRPVSLVEKHLALFSQPPTP
ncbi:MAG: phosphatidylglycerol lysyltransferase domain-containing protein [Bacteroidales bacterium]|jgi:hypothetical protein|nr:phosphatidylglycerol lysyltransferase domain-containing protein [Bacteroidales bacterium]MDD2263368.1 phosphatidylglycerol lysyltransferase domain-containing protein [Bacteroidales bacterium]MDD2830842.1 phosphatidylglycerol lysyltransferase domain-containing protein [Bacteroidales bacterium]MDD3208041.1 phosphatidylglycerol lysyltransferase domain-containing protein [Bacteroidales bacterium]MDD3696452.1 phosphatidylglycerol lysyltransferase domain-containing protein [Bacteroidales bacterium